MRDARTDWLAEKERIDNYNKVHDKSGRFGSTGGKKGGDKVAIRAARVKARKDVVDSRQKELKNLDSDIHGTLSLASKAAESGNVAVFKDMGKKLAKLEAAHNLKVKQVNEAQGEVLKEISK